MWHVVLSRRWIESFFDRIKCLSNTKMRFDPSSSVITDSSQVGFAIPLSPKEVQSLLMKDPFSLNQNFPKLSFKTQGLLKYFHEFNVFTWIYVHNQHIIARDFKSHPQAHAAIKPTHQKHFIVKRFQVEILIFW